MTGGFLYSIRWDHGQALLSSQGEFICSACFKIIPEDHVPVHLWKNYGLNVATFCGDCDGEAIKAATSAIGVQAAKKRA